MTRVDSHRHTLDKLQKKWIQLVLVLLINIQSVAAEQLVVIAHPSLPVDHLSQREIINIFMGRQQTLNNNTALPIDLANSAFRAQFYLALLQRDLAEIDSYWARLMFSGQRSPPPKIEHIDQVIEKVANTPAAIAYIPVTNINTRVKVVHTLHEQ